MSLIRLDSRSSPVEIEPLKTVCRRTKGRLFVITKDDVKEFTTNIINGLRSWYEAAARENPTLDLIPLLHFAGWTTESISQLEELTTFYYTTDSAEESLLFLQRINRLRGDKNLREIKAEKSVNTRVEAPLSFAKVVVGGTFDRLHAGHRLLLSVSALITTSKLIVGITDEDYLQNKEYKALIKPLEFRKRTAAEFIKTVHPKIEFYFSILSDLKSPVAAEVEADLDALVVSKDTIVGGEKINATRKEQGMKPLELVVVDLVEGDNDPKLCSTELRRAELANTQN